MKQHRTETETRGWGKQECHKLLPPKLTNCVIHPQLLNVSTNEWAFFCLCAFSISFQGRTEGYVGSNEGISRQTN